MTSVFKFRAATEDHDIDALVQGYLWFSKLKDLNDPFEGAYYLNHQVSKDLLFKYHANVLAKKPLRFISPDDEVVEMYIDKERGSPGGYEQWLKQLTMKEIDEELSKLRGVYSIFCIEYHLDTLVDSLNQKYDCFDKAPVNYVEQDNAPEICLEDVLADAIEGTFQTHSSLLTAMTTKCKNPWDQENELRIVGECQDGKYFHSLAAIKAIYVGSKMESVKLKRLVKFAKENTIPIIRVHNALHNKRYGFGYEKLDSVVG
ncbi:hypothetical protein PRUB_b1472 [Pseudoalteromonas rubra]|uniref:Uncharacterized protein n=2 Tax=Pseudoalteromonas rubra TaxID=43658 RepID=A0A8T0C2A4_9GAMM|nr:hypothetical protein PRUB_b1472 [Pseudoalteromonas rubra]